jgi:phosphatidylserine/phosphatidylglycerophosphate/cardiolipin synthase-like enzyme
MRKTAKKNGVSLKAYAGTTGVLLATDVDKKKRKGLLGYAVERKVGGGKREWLKGMLRFPNGGEPSEAGLPIDTNLAPVQKFRWSDYRVLPDTVYEYTVHPVYGEPGNLDVEPGPNVKMRAASNLKGEHRIVFNRAAAASQAFARNFPEVDEMLEQWRKEKKKNKDLEEPTFPAEVLKWLTRGVLEQILGFIEQAKDETWALDVAIYEYELPEIVRAVKAAHQRKVDVRVVYHAKNGDPQTEENEHSLKGFPTKRVRGRLTNKIFHDKFIVLSRMVDGKRDPKSVLCGSTNFTHNGVYRQGNVVHVLDRVDAAEQYLTLFELLFRGDTTAQTRKFVTENNLMDDAKPVFVGFSPRKGLGDLQAIARAIGSAKRDVLFCTAFDLNDDIEAALLGKAKDPILRYGVQNTRSAITGFHADRSADFSATAMLSKGLEGFQKESTRGQRGNILIHTKLVVVDFTSDNPIVISGSHNLSKSASDGNDENYLIIRGNTDVADSYGCELMRLYDHYRFRFIAREKEKTGKEQKPLFLRPDDSWTDPYFNPKSLKMNDRLKFSGK